MTMKNCRRLASATATLTILCGGSLKLFPKLPAPAVCILSVCAILMAVLTVFIVIRFHRCPGCRRFIPITLKPDTCPHCQKALN